MSINENNHSKFYSLIMEDSDNFHQTCRDSDPSFTYLSDWSLYLQKTIKEFNSSDDGFRAAYTFDAGQNAFIIVSQQHEKVLLNLLE